MAKSIRSKRMRKLRAFKRIRYGEKELTRLKNMLAKAAEEENNNVNEDDKSDNVTVIPRMEVDPEPASASSEKPSSKYPCWLSHFKIRRLAKQERKQKRKEAKRLKKEKKGVTTIKSLHRRGTKKTRH